MESCNNDAAPRARTGRECWVLFRSGYNDTREIYPHGSASPFPLPGFTHMVEAGTLPATQGGEVSIPRQQVDAMLKSLYDNLDTQHWEECAARKPENEDEIDDNPGEFLVDCECSIRPIHEIYGVLKSALASAPKPTAPEGQP